MKDSSVTKVERGPVAQNDQAVAMADSLKAEADRRGAIVQFIGTQLKEGVDYGKIGKFPKPTLLKPGAEKFCSLLHLVPKFRKDVDTLSMLPETVSSHGVIAFICELWKGDQIVAEGRGACSVFEKQGAVNTAIKIAEKRSLMDAVLRAFSISDSFTQDLDDMEQPIPMGPQRPAQVVTKPKAPDMTREQRNAERLKLNETVKAGLASIGWDKAGLDAFVALTHPEAGKWERLSLEQARECWANILKEQNNG